MDRVRFYQLKSRPLLAHQDPLVDPAHHCLFPFPEPSTVLNATSTPSAPFIDMDHQSSLSQQEPIILFPAAAYEIALLTSAQGVAKRKEMNFFQQLSHRHQWQMSQAQRERYMSRMQGGYTLILTDRAKTILWTTANFLSMTGYSPREVLGQTPKLLQGAATDPLVARHVGDSLRGSHPVKADLLNYRKDGQSYMCRLWIDPLHSSQGEHTHFLAVAVEYAPKERLR